MSYHDDLFPLGIAYGARGGPMFNTTVLELASGYEKRNMNWSKVKARYNVMYGVKKPAQMTELLNFFYARRGRAYSFPFYDHKDHLITNQIIGKGDGVKKEFQIIKTYSSGGHSYERLITKLKPDTISGVTVGGVPRVLNSVDANGYTVDNLTGKITFVTAPLAGTDIVVGSCEFYVHVRFDTDYMDIQLVTYDAETWADIFLVEVKEDV